MQHMSSRGLKAAGWTDVYIHLTEPQQDKVICTAAHKQQEWSSPLTIIPLQNSWDLPRRSVSAQTGLCSTENHILYTLAVVAQNQQTWALKRKAPTRRILAHVTARSPSWFQCLTPLTCGLLLADPTQRLLLYTFSTKFYHGRGGTVMQREKASLKPPSLLFICGRCASSIVPKSIPFIQSAQFCSPIRCKSAQP
jgi:hypothetical protein